MGLGAKLYHFGLGKDGILEERDSISKYYVYLVLRHSMKQFMSNEPGLSGLLRDLVLLT